MDMAYQSNPAVSLPTPTTSWSLKQTTKSAYISHKMKQNGAKD